MQVPLGQRKCKTAAERVSEAQYDHEVESLSSSNSGVVPMVKHDLP